MYTQNEKHTDQRSIQSLTAAAIRRPIGAAMQIIECGFLLTRIHRRALNATSTRNDTTATNTRRRSGQKK